MATLLVVDDEQHTCESLEVILRREGHRVATAASGEAALAYMRDQEVDLILSDVRMPGMGGLNLLRQVKTRDASIVVVMMSGHSDVGAAVEAMKEGAFDYLIKPFGKDNVLQTIRKALTLRTVLVENVALKRQMQDHFARAQVIGSSPVWRQVCTMIEQVAPARATVLLTGESGTGKELLAQLVHRLSPRAARPFVTLNAAALPPTLLEAELFGYEKGAFTGALQRKPGRFELADSGTLFLDEIGEMPLEVQVKLLRVLQDGTFERLGGTRTQQVDVRIVAATNKDLHQEVVAKRFREDLYFRINVVTVELPPLRERREDIPRLAAHFMQKYIQQNQKAVTAIHQEALRRLQAYGWPGNVRELEHVIERAVVLAQETTIRVADLPPRFHAFEPVFVPCEHIVLPANATLAEIEHAALIQALQHCGGNRQAAARLLDIGVATLYRKLKEYHIP
jgi:two-component system response regulator HydG